MTGKINPFVFSVSKFAQWRWPLKSGSSALHVINGPTDVSPIQQLVAETANLISVLTISHLEIDVMP
jgi:hypothetical protein